MYFGSKDRCREALGDDRFGKLEAWFAPDGPLPADIDRGDVYFVIELAELGRQGHNLYDPSWCRRRDDAYREVKSAIDLLTSVFRVRGELVSETQGLYGELSKLREAELTSKPGPVDFRENTRVKLLTMDRPSLGWARAGRGKHAEPWKAEGIKLLGEVLSKDTALSPTKAKEFAKDLLRDIGLYGWPTTTREDDRAT